MAVPAPRSGGWSTRIAVVVMVIAVIGGGGYANLESVPGYAPWQDKAPTFDAGGFLLGGAAALVASAALRAVMSRQSDAMGRIAELAAPELTRVA